MNFVPAVGAINRRPDANVHHSRVPSSPFIDYPDSVDAIARDHFARIKQLQIGRGEADRAAPAVTGGDFFTFGGGPAAKALEVADGAYYDSEFLGRLEKMAYPDPSFLNFSHWVKNGWLKN